MRIIYFLLIPIFLSAQTEDYPTIKIIDMNGMTNAQEDTWLIYRTHFDYKRNPKNIFESSIHYYNPKTNFDSLMWIGRHLSIIEIEIPGYIAFWDNNPFKWIRFVFDEFSGTNYIYQYNYGRRFQKEIYGLLYSNRINISETQPNIAFLSYFDSTFVSSDSGRNWNLFKNSIFVIGVNKFFNNIIYAINTDNQLLFSNDGGNSFFISDDNTIWDRQTKIYFDKDKKHIYAIINTEDHAYFLISPDNGKPYTWNIIKTKKINHISDYYTGENYKFSPYLNLSIDDSTLGRLFFSAGQSIYASANFGYNLNQVYNTSSQITGLFIPPKSDSLYYSTAFGLFTFQDSISKTIKYLKTNYNFFPLQSGNKWIYHVNHIECDLECTGYEFYEIVEILNDTTILENTYKVISNSDYFIKNSTDCTKVVYYNPFSKKEKLLYDFENVPGDSVKMGFPDDIYISDGTSIFVEEKLDTLFDELHLMRTYILPHSLYGQSYKVVNGFGIAHEYYTFDWGERTKTLKGAIINGVVYGDTTLTSLTPEPKIALEFQLSPNYPNPFNPTTTIEYSLRKTGFVTLSVYDINGRLVKNLVNKKQPAGKHQVVYDATSLTSGIYYYRLKSGGFSKTNKMILLK